MKDAGRSEMNAVLSGAVLYGAGALIFTVMPAYLGHVGTRYDVSAAELGVLTAGELWAIAFASLTGPFWINRFQWRTLARIGAFFALLGQIASLLVGNFQFLLVIRMLTGTIGEGLLLALSYSLLAQTRNVERSFSLAYGAATAVGMTCLYVSPELDRVLGTVSILTILAGLAALAMLAASLIPLQSEDRSPRNNQGLPSDRFAAAWRSPGALALISQAIWYAGAGGFWSFTEQLAAHNSVPAAGIAHAMGIGTAGAIIGAFLALGLNGRFGRAVPIVVSTGLMAIAIVNFMSSGDTASVTVELVLFNVFWASGTIYLTAATCETDGSGKIAVLVPAFQTIGMAVGAVVLGHFIDRLGFGVTPWIIGTFFVAALMLMAIAGTRRTKRLGTGAGLRAPDAQ